MSTIKSIVEKLKPHLSGGDGADEGEVRQGLPVVFEHHLLQDVHARVVPLHHILVGQRPPRLVVDLEPLLSRQQATARSRRSRQG